MSANRPQKKWGQNFLRNQPAAQRIADAVRAVADELVLEIGPGEGALTAALLRAGHRLRVIEIDPGLVDRLRNDFPAIDVIEGDAVEVALPEEPFSAVGNLPYNVGTPILRRVIRNPFCRQAVFMLQKEVVDRILAAPGEEPYGYLTLYVQLYCEASLLMTLKPGSFHPRPRVKSAVVELRPVQRSMRSRHETFLELVSASFRMRRKKLINNLGGFQQLSREAIAGLLDDAAIDRQARAEAISFDDFDRLASAIERSGAAPGSPPEAHPSA